MAVVNCNAAPESINCAADNGSQAVTVPADCTLAVAILIHYDNTSSNVSSIDFNGTEVFTLRTNNSTQDPAFSMGVCIATFKNPTTGSRTLNWSYSAGAGRDGNSALFLWFLKGEHATAYFTDSGHDSNGSGTGNVAVTLTSDTDELILAVGHAYQQNPALDATVVVDNYQPAASDNRFDASEITPSGTSHTVNMTNENFSAMGAISIAPAAVGGVTAFTHRGIRGGMANLAGGML